MKKNFKLTKESKVNWAGKTLFRIQATISFKSITKGDKGGWVEAEANMYGDAWVYGNAKVYGNARVYGNAWVSGDARVYGNARVYGDAWKKSPLQIQGTDHFINICKKGFLKIGCFELSFMEWKKEFKRIGKSNGYTPTQIKEYGAYIDLAIKLNPKPKKKIKS